MNQELKSWLNANNIVFESKGPRIFDVKGLGHVLCLEGTEEKILDDKLNLIIADSELEQVVLYDVKLVAFEFGGLFYYVSIDDVGKTIENVKILRNIGTFETQFEGIERVHLGLRGTFELMNSCRLYTDWIERAKYLGFSTLAICEYETLAGTLQFQVDCLTAGIKPVIGATYSLYENDERLDFKIFAINENGWQNILKLNKIVNCDKNKITRENFLNAAEHDVYIALSHKFVKYPEIANQVVRCSNGFFQFDTVEFDNDHVDVSMLNDYKEIVDKYGWDAFVLINDSFYIYKGDHEVKNALNRVANITRDPRSKDQFFKTYDESFERFNALFDSMDLSLDIFIKMISNSIILAKECAYNTDTKNLHLPEFKMNLLPERYLKCKNSEELFWQIINEAFEKKIVETGKDVDIYMQRIDSEMKIINMGKLIDYFLIAWDINRWCRENRILHGVGRGSSGGCLIAFLMDIVTFDPIEYDLLFERFLNENRVLTSNPDIDSDFEGIRRDDIKKHLEEKYGIEHFASVGTYSTMKTKMALQDLCRANGVPHSTATFITSILGDEEADGKTWWELIQIAVKSDAVKSFIKTHPEVVNQLHGCMGQHRSGSVHASATIIVPYEKSIYEWLPVKVVDGMMVTEWEGILVDKAGFLKEDLLGIAQLDKFRSIIDLIEKHTGELIDLYSIPLDDKKVYRLFQKGFNEDVFQFGTDGLKAFSKALKPENLNHLIAMNALYRPGAMQSNAHNDYVAIKNGEKEIEYDFGLESVTKDTYGLYLYQEQTMLAAQVLADFTLTEADMLRKNMLGRGKKQHLDKLQPYKDKFFANALAKSCPEEELNRIWEKLEAFSGYGFVKAHATAYGITAYYSQWFKANYPLEFWTVALEFSTPKNIYKRINELRQLKSSGIELMPPDVNKSGMGFIPDAIDKKIYWSLSSISHVAEVATNSIINERNVNGKFFSLGDFLSRQKAMKGVNKKVIAHLILSGAFDAMYEVTDPTYRAILMYEYLEATKQQPEEDYAEKDEFWWISKQKLMCGFGYIDYRIFLGKNKYARLVSQFVDAYDFYSTNDGTTGVIVGIVLNFVEKHGKKGDFGRVDIESNNEMMSATIWTEQWEDVKNEILEGRYIIMKGIIRYNSWSKKNVIYSFDASEIYFI